MDDFYNFYDNPNNDNNPNNSNPKLPDDKEVTYLKLKKSNTALIIICVLLAIIVVVNIVVLAVMRNTIADKFVSSIESSVNENLDERISNALGDTDIVSNIEDKATDKAVDRLGVSIGEYAFENCMSACAVITCSDSGKNSTATGFLINDGEKRYMLTNHHVVTYEKTVKNAFGMTTTSTEVFSSIKCNFYGESTKYSMSVVYMDASLDLALLTFTSNTPSSVTHPSLKIAKTDFTTIGEEVAIIGNPQGIGLSITTGNLSHSATQISGWGNAYYIMTDAAVNSGNSGGPMLDSNGVVIGVVESKIVEDDVDNMGFAVAIVSIISFLNEAEEDKNISIGYILVTE